MLNAAKLLVLSLALAACGMAAQVTPLAHPATGTPNAAATFSPPSPTPEAVTLDSKATPTQAPQPTDTPANTASTTVEANNTFSLTAQQAQEVTAFMEFIRAYNTGQLEEALALLDEHAGVSDCDYQAVKVILFRGKSQAAEWLRQRIADHDHLEVSGIYDENPDRSSGEHVIEVEYARRTSTTLAKLGFVDGITPKLASKVIFAPEPTLIASFANGPYGGDPKLCRPGSY